MPFLDINLLNYSKIFNDKNLYKNQKPNLFLELFLKIICKKKF